MNGTSYGDLILNVQWSRKHFFDWRFFGADDGFSRSSTVAEMICLVSTSDNVVNEQFQSVLLHMLIDDSTQLRGQSENTLHFTRNLHR